MFMNDSLTMMHEAIRAALAADDGLKRQAIETRFRFRVRETAEWKLHAAELETEMLKRGMMFEVIDWSEDQAVLPFDERQHGFCPALRLAWSALVNAE
jgi:hypothetical protein